MTTLLKQFIELGLPSALAADFAEAVPTLTGNRESVHFARNLIRVLTIYAEAWEELPPEEVRRMDLPPHKGLVAIACYQPWKLHSAIRKYVESRLDEDAWDLHIDGLFDDVVARLVNEARELANEGMSEDFEAD